MTVRIVVADDHPLYRDGLVQALRQHGAAEVVAEVGTGADAVAAVDAHQPDVVILDLHMPEGNGIEATRAITADHPSTAVLVLTMVEGDSALRAALRAGARGYLVKGATRAEIIRAVEAVAAGQVILGGDAAGRLDAVLGTPTTSGRPFAHLSDREHTVLDLMAQGLTNPAIAARLHLSDKTVRNYVSRIFAELHVTDRGAAIAHARNAGLGVGGGDDDRW